jgi:hypothetical protein
MDDEDDFYSDEDYFSDIEALELALVYDQWILDTCGITE